MIERIEAPDARGNSANRLAAALVLAAASSVLTWLTKRVVSGRSERAETAMRDWMQAHRHPALDVVTRPVTLLSMPIIVVSATMTLALWLKKTGRAQAALAVTAAPVLAAAMGQSFTTFVPQRQPPDGKDEASFPSGHTTGVTAEALTICYALLQEDLATPRVLTALVAWPIVVGLARVYRNRHWFNDIVGGWVAGAGVAALTILLASKRSPGEPERR